MVSRERVVRRMDGRYFWGHVREQRLEGGASLQKMAHVAQRNRRMRLEVAGESIKSAYRTGFRVVVDSSGEEERGVVNSSSEKMGEVAAAISYQELMDIATPNLAKLLILEAIHKKKYAEAHALWVALDDKVQSGEKVWSKVKMHWHEVLTAPLGATDSWDALKEPPGKEFLNLLKKHVLVLKNEKGESGIGRVIDRDMQLLFWNNDIENFGSEVRDYVLSQVGQDAIKNGVQKAYRKWLDNRDPQAQNYGVGMWRQISLEEMPLNRGTFFQSMRMINEAAEKRIEDHPKFVEWKQKFSSQFVEMFEKERQANEWKNRPKALAEMERLLLLKESGCSKEETRRRQAL